MARLSSFAATFQLSHAKALAVRGSLREKLSQKTFRVSHAIYWFAAFNKCVPFEPVGKEDLRVKRFKSAWKLLLWHAANWIFIFSFFFQWASFIHEIATKPFSQGTAIHLSIVAAISFNFIFMVTMYLKSEEAIFLLNQQDFMAKSLKPSKLFQAVLNFCQYICATWVFIGLGLPKCNYWAAPFVVFSVNYVAVICVSTCCILVAFYIVNPERSCYVYAYLPQVLKESRIVYCISLFYEAMNLIWAMNILIVFYIFWCTDLYLFNHMFKYLS